MTEDELADLAAQSTLALVECIHELEAENAKLRQLLRRVWDLAAEARPWIEWDATDFGGRFEQAERDLWENDVFRLG